MSFNLFEKVNFNDDDMGGFETDPLNRYPRVQWHSGKQGDGGPLFNGGWNISKDSIDNIYTGLPYKVNRVTYSNGTQADCYLFPELHFCFIGTPIFANSYWDEKLGRYRVWKTKKSVPIGIKTTFKAWTFCYVKEFLKYSESPKPFIVSLSGAKALKVFSNRPFNGQASIIMDFNKEVLETANNLRKEENPDDYSPFPTFRFWVKIGSTGLIQTRINNFPVNGAYPKGTWESKVQLATLSGYKDLAKLAVPDELMAYIGDEGLDVARDWRNELYDFLDFEDEQKTEKVETKPENGNGYSDDVMASDLATYNPDEDDD